MRVGVRLSLEAASWKRIVTPRALKQHEAEHVVDMICASAIRELVASNAINDIGERRKRAKDSGIIFHRAANPRAVAQAGLIKTDGAVTFQMVSEQDYAEYTHSFVLPPE